MNTLMYEYPLTNEHLRVVKEVIGYTVVGPIGKTLACGDVGESLICLNSYECLSCVRCRSWSNDRMARYRDDCREPVQPAAQVTVKYAFLDISAQPHVCFPQFRCLVAYNILYKAPAPTVQ